jgi:hypothetical protein
MIKLFLVMMLSSCSLFSPNKAPQKIFDVHLHGSEDIGAQVRALQQGGVYKAAVSSSWVLQNVYRQEGAINWLFGLMFPCPNAKVPYSLQPCFEDGKDWPALNWVEQQVKAGKINFFGEVLNQYYGIGSSDTLLFPYYALAMQYGLPVGIHTGGAGPNHGSPNFKMELGNPQHMEKLLIRFPGLKVWIMHAGDQYYKEAIAVMQRHHQVYADLSVLCNPDIVPPERFTTIMKAFTAAGLQDRLMFGTDNADVLKAVAAVEGLTFLTAAEKDDIFYRNAERFFISNR